MFPVSAYAALVPYVAALLAYLAGLVVAIILLIRAKGTAAILAVVGFALLVLISIGQIVLTLPPVGRQIFRAGQWLAWLLNCCCGFFDLVAIVCLIVAIWQAVLPTGGEGVDGDQNPFGDRDPFVEEMEGEFVEISEEVIRTEEAVEESE